METKIRLLPLREAQTIAFKEEMQEAFQHGFHASYKDDNQWQVLPVKDFYQSLETEGAEAYEAIDADGQRVGGTIIAIDAAKNHGELMEQREQSQACLSYVERRMRKASRQMDAAFALEVLDKAPYVTVCMTRPDGTPYGLPLSLARTDENTFYFHCALEGDKLDCIAHNPTVFMSAVTKCSPTVGPKDGSFTLQYKSATAVGKAEIVTDREEKIAGLRAICQRFLPHHMDAFDDAITRSLERTAVVKITLTEPPVGKRKQYDKQGEEMKYGRME